MEPPHSRPRAIGLKIALLVVLGVVFSLIFAYPASFFDLWGQFVFLAANILLDTVVPMCLAIACLSKMFTPEDLSVLPKRLFVASAIWGVIVVGLQLFNPWTYLSLNYGGGIVGAIVTNAIIYPAFYSGILYYFLKHKFGRTS